MGRAARRRFLRQANDRVRHNETIWALNCNAGFETNAGPTINVSQDSALNRIRHLDRVRGLRGRKADPRAALMQLLRKEHGGYAADVAQGSLAPYVREDVSIPHDQGAAPPLCDHLPEDERHVLTNFSESMFLPPSEMAQLYDDTSAFDCCYHDPALSDSGVYAKFIFDLYNAGLIAFTSNPRVIIGVFFVTKKNGRLRMIIDCRRINNLMRQPPRTLLGSVEALANIDLSCHPGDVHQTMFIAQEDVKDFFYRLGIPEGMWPLFSFPAVDVNLLRKCFGNDVPNEIQCLSETAAVHPCMRVLPMGFSWAFHLAQRCHEFEAAAVLPNVDLLRDRRPFYRLTPKVSRLMLYADNNNHIALDAETADASRIVLSKRLNETGLATHEVGEAAVCGSTLGIQFNGDIGYIAVTHERDVRLDLALEELILRRPKITSADMRRIVGHITCRFLLRRSLLSTLAHVYVFINKEYTYPTTMWPSLVSELRVVRGLLVFAVAEMRTIVDGCVHDRRLFKWLWGGTVNVVLYRCIRSC